MRINSICNFRYNISFAKKEKLKNYSASLAIATNPLQAEILEHCSISYYFRNDLDWPILKNYLNNKFKNYQKVNSYIYGCAQGYEPYSLAALFSCCDNGSKFYPIEAMDISEDVISENIKRQKNEILLDGYECAIATKNLKNMGCKDISEIMDVPPPYMPAQAKLKRKITDKVIFSCSDIVSDIDKIDAINPSVIMCRNMWPYINPENYDKCASIMYEKAAKGSVVIIGYLDNIGIPMFYSSDKFPDSLIKFGFKPVDTAQASNIDFRSDGSKSILIYEK